MAGDVGDERRKGSVCGRLLKLRPPMAMEPPELDMSFSRYVLFVTYLLKAVTGFGYLALTWSTVVLLGGFVTTLQPKDFGCLTIISMIQAARIFHDLAEQMIPNFIDLVTRTIQYNGQLVQLKMWHVTGTFHRKGLRGAAAAWSTWTGAAFVLYGWILMLPFLVLCYVPALLYIYGGPIACFALALWRIVQRDYGVHHDRHHKNKPAPADLLTPALVLFYSMVLLQGILYLVWLSIDSWWPNHLIALRSLCKLPRTAWCRLALVEYLLDMRAKCWRDLSSIHGRTLADYAADLLDSRSWEDNLCGVRLLDAVIRQGTADVRSLLLPSRRMVHKLVDILGWRHGQQAWASREMRELAALDLQGRPHPQKCIKLPPQKQAMLLRLEKRELQVERKKEKKRERELEKKRELEEKGEVEPKEKREPEAKRGELDTKARFHLGGSSNDHTEARRCNELILQGLTIFERLASDHHNCREICSIPGLLPKITAPLYSDTLIQDINIGAWADVVNGSFKVVCQLIRAPGEASTSLRREISSNKKAVKNLETILHQYRAGPLPPWPGSLQDMKRGELWMQSLEMLTELVLDSPLSLTKATKVNLIKKQLQIFLAEEEHSERASKPNPLKVTAGRMLVLISTSSQANSNDNFPRLTGLPDDKKIIVNYFIDITEDNNNVDCLTKMLDATNHITYRTIAAEILENFCTHCDWIKHEQTMKESLLPKVLTEIMSIESNHSERKNSEEKENRPQGRRWALFKMKNSQGNNENKKISAPGKDEENQQKSAPGTDKQDLEKCMPEDVNMIQDISSSGDQKESSHQQNKEETTHKKELLEELLSLTLVICGKLTRAGDVAKDLGGDAFMVKLKTIINDNCKPTADSLRIVKLCGQIAESMMQSQPYAKHFINKEFGQSLSKASEIMYSLESCMMFSGTDFGRKNTVRPLLSELQKKVTDLEKKAPESA